MAITKGRLKKDEFNHNKVSKLERWIQLFKEGLFGVLYVMAKDSHLGSNLVILSITVDFLQVLGFHFSTIQRFPLNPRWTDWFIQLLSKFRLEGWTNSGNETNPGGGVIFYFVLLIVVCIIGCGFYVGYSFSKNRFKYLWPLKVLRSFASLTTIMYIPVLNQFVLNLSCTPEMNCFSGLRLVESIITIVVGVSFAIFSFLVQATYFEDDPTRNVGTGRPHSRADLAYISMRTWLAISYQLFIGPKYHLFLTLSTFTFTTATALMFSWYLPYYNTNIGRYKAVLMWLLDWATICIGIAILKNSPNDSGPTLSFFLGCPPVACTAIAVMMSRKEWIQKTNVQNMSSPFEVGLKAHLALKPVREMMIELKQFKFHMTSTPNHEGGNHPQQKQLQELNNDEANSEMKLIQRLNDKIERLCLNAESILLEGIRKFPKSSLMQIFRAQFYLVYRPKSHMGIRSLMLAEAMSPQLDEHFIIYRRRKKAMEEQIAMMNQNESDVNMKSNNSGGGGGDVISNIAFDQYLKDAFKYDIYTISNQLKFWYELKSSGDKLNEYTELIALNQGNALMNYMQIIQMRRDSPFILRAYASFLQDHIHDKESSQLMIQQANQCEQREQRELFLLKSSMKSSNDFDSSSNCVVICSGEMNSKEQTIGEIQRANLSFCSLFGYMNENELIGKNINSLVPHPWNAYHNQLMFRHIDTGRSKFLDDSGKTYPRQAHALHKDGYSIRVLITLKQIIHSDSKLSFIAITNPIQQPSSPLNCEDLIEGHFIVNMSTASRNCKSAIVSLSRECFHIFGMTPNDIRRRFVPIETWFPEWFQFRKFAQSEKGVKIAFSPPKSGDPTDSLSLIPYIVVDSHTNKPLILSEMNEKEENDYYYNNNDHLKKKGNQIRNNKMMKWSGIVNDVMKLESITRSLRSTYEQSGKWIEIWIESRIIRDENYDLVVFKLRKSLYDLIIHEKLTKSIKRNPSLSGRLQSVRNSIFHNNLNRTIGENEKSNLLIEHNIQESDDIESLEKTMPINGNDIDRQSQTQGESGSELSKTDTPSNHSNEDENDSNKSSEHTATTTTPINLSMLKKSLFYRLNSKEYSNGIRRVIYIFRMILCVIISLVCVNHTIIHTTIQQYMDNAPILHRLSLRNYYLLTIIDSVQYLTTIDHHSNHTNDEYDMTKQIIGQCADELESISASLLEMKNDLTLNHRSMMNDAQITGYNIINNEEIQEKLTLIDATHRIVSKSRLIIETPIENITMNNENVFVIMKNTLLNGPFANAFNISTSLYRIQMKDQYTDQKTIIMTLSIVNIIISLIVIVVYFRPIVYCVHHNKQRVFSIFYALPRPLIDIIHENCGKRLETIRNMIQQQHSYVKNPQSLNALINEEQEHFKTMSINTNMNMKNEIKSDDDENHKESSNEIMMTIRIIRMYLSIFIRSLLIVILCCLYLYVQMWINGLDQWITDLYSAPNIIMYSQYRRTLLRHTALSLRYHYYSNQYDNHHHLLYNQLTHQHSLQRIDELYAIEQSLIYGSNPLHIQSVVLSNNALNMDRYELLFIDACHNMHNIELFSSCHLFGNGLLLNGLHVTILEYIRLSREQITIYKRSTTPAPTNQQFIENLIDLERDYIQTASMRDLDMYMSLINDHIQIFKNRSIYVTIAFILVAFVIHLLIHETMLRKLNQTIIQTKSLLFMIPFDHPLLVSCSSNFLQQFFQISNDL